MRPQPILGLLEIYVLGCIGHLPAEQEALMSRRIPQTYERMYGRDADWKTTLSRVLKLADGLDERLRQKWLACQAEAAKAGTPSDPRQFTKQALEDAGFAHLLNRLKPPDTIPPAPWTSQITVKAVGFWRDNEGQLFQYPRAQDLVQPGWHAADLKRIVTYLQSGYNAHPSVMFCGWSTCRFEGCVEGQCNGSRELTDGEWGWPEGLAHYVERHEVILPEEFIATMRARHWIAPPLPNPPHLTNLDHSFWIGWAGALSV